MMAALGSVLQWSLVGVAVTCALFLVGPYVIYPLRERMCPHRGDGVWLLRSRYEAMLGAIDDQRVENAELREQLRRYEASEDEQTIARIIDYLGRQGAK